MCMSNEEEPRYCVNCGQPLTNAAVNSTVVKVTIVRLYTRLGQVAEDDMEKVKGGFRSIYLGE